MKVRLITDNVAVYSIMDLSSNPLTVLTSGSYITLGKSKKKNNTLWIEATTSDRIVGYILNVDCVPIKKVELLQNETKIYSDPGSESTIIGSIKKGEIFYIEDTIETENGKLVRMSTTTDKHGFIKGDVIIKDISKDENSNSSSLELYKYIGWISATIFAIIDIADGMKGGAIGLGKMGAVGFLAGAIIGFILEYLLALYKNSKT